MVDSSLPGTIEWLILIPVAAVLVAVQWYPVWRICQRLGRPGYWSVLMFVPLGFPILLWILAIQDPPSSAEA